MVLGKDLPRNLMCHAHIFSKADRKKMMRWLGLSDVHAGGNGLLLAKPIQV
jgi:hypothetical protein